jgi:hypothetical protein
MAARFCQTESGDAVEAPQDRHASRNHPQADDIREHLLARNVAQDLYRLMGDLEFAPDKIQDAESYRC